MTLLADRPIEKITTRSVALEVGVSQPALFRHFRSRDAMFVAAVEAARDDMATAVASIFQGSAAPVERIRILCDTLLDYVEQHPGLPRLLVVNTSGRCRSIRVALEALLASQIRLFEELIRAAERVGAVRSDTGRTGAIAIVSIVQGIILQWERGGRQPGLAKWAAPVFEIWHRGVATYGAAAPSPSAREPQPEPEREPVPAGVRELDVRPILARGVDPLDDILAALGGLGSGGLLHVTAPFQPRPLIALLTSRGHVVDAASLGERAWSVAIAVGGKCGVDDLRDLEPPEPLERVLVGSTQDGAYIARLPRFPRLLVPRLQERGRAWRVLELEDDTALVWIAP